VDCNISYVITTYHNLQKDIFFWITVIKLLNLFWKLIKTDFCYLMIKHLYNNMIKNNNNNKIIKRIIKIIINTFFVKNMKLINIHCI